MRDIETRFAYVALRVDLHAMFKMLKITLVSGRYDRDNFRHSEQPRTCRVRSPLVPTSTLEPMHITRAYAEVLDG
jgi:hypothetical protein